MGNKFAPYLCKVPGNDEIAGSYILYINLHNLVFFYMRIIQLTKIH